MSIRQKVTIAIVAVVGTAAAAFAQTRPSQSYANQSGYAGTGRYSDALSAAVAAVPDARANLVNIRARQRLVEGNMTSTLSELKRQFADSSQLRDAVAGEFSAWQALEDARSRALLPLQSNPDYLAALSLMRDADSHVQLLRSLSWPSHKRIVEAATLKMSYAAMATRMEKEAIDADPQVAQARQRLQEASQRVNQLYGDFAQRVRNNEQLAAVRQTMAQLQVDHLTADVYYRETVRARNISLGYALYLNRYPAIPVYDYYGYSPLYYYNYRYRY